MNDSNNSIDNKCLSLPCSIIGKLNSKATISKDSIRKEGLTHTKKSFNENYIEFCVPPFSIHHWMMPKGSFSSL